MSELAAMSDARCGSENGTGSLPRVTASSRAGILFRCSISQTTTSNFRKS